MAKIKTSISLDQKLLALLDERAREQHLNRSELIESLCREQLAVIGNEQVVETFKATLMPTQIVPVLTGMFEWDDQDGPLEVIFRVPLSQYKRWRKRLAEDRRND